MHDRHEPRDDLAADMLKGAVAGLAATWVMDRVDWWMHRHESEDSRRRTWAVRPEHKDPAHVLASRASQAFGGDPIPQGHPAGLAVHYAIGVAPAVLYGALRGRVPGVDAGAGLAFGAAMSVVEDEIANPLLGLSAPPREYPWQPHARGLVAHLVYGIVAELVLRGLQPRPAARQPRRQSWAEAPSRRPPASWRGRPAI